MQVILKKVQNDIYSFFHLSNQFHFNEKSKRCFLAVGITEQIESSKESEKIFWMNLYCNLAVHYTDISLINNTRFLL